MHPSPATDSETSHHLKGIVVPARFEVVIELGNASWTCACVGIAEDGFVVEGGQPLPTNHVVRCRLVAPDGELELFGFAAAAARGDHQEIKSMGLKGPVAERWQSLRRTFDVGDSLGVRARGTRPTGPIRSGVYVTLPHSKQSWVRRLFGIKR